MKCILIAIFAFLSLQVHALALPFGLEVKKGGHGGGGGHGGSHGGSSSHGSGSHGGGSEGEPEGGGSSGSGSGSGSHGSGSGSGSGGEPEGGSGGSGSHGSGSGSGSGGEPKNGGNSGSNGRGSSGNPEHPDGGTKGKVKANDKGYGHNKRPDYSQNSDHDIPPPYYSGHNAPPPPYHAGTYGQRGPTRSYWNGQYYPYRHYGYGGYLPLGVGLSPFFFAGPFGFYGPYCNDGAKNCTIRSLYINGQSNSSSNDVLVNGTFVKLRWSDGEYYVDQYDGGSYEGGQTIQSSNGSRVSVFGTYHGSNSPTKTSTINPNTTVDGTELRDNKSSQAQPPYNWSTFALLAAVSGIVNFM